ncbi:hypothetical protein A2U01_0086392, partial [Trifolium medium]|nr:hypothetical protein [Trifolium medium]
MVRKSLDLGTLTNSNNTTVEEHASKRAQQRRLHLRQREVHLYIGGVL